MRPTGRYLRRYAGSPEPLAEAIGQAEAARRRE
jgi:hypothetical protein